MGNGRQTILDRLRKTFRIDYDDDCLDKWEGIELVTKSLDQQSGITYRYAACQCAAGILYYSGWNGRSCCQRSTAIIRLGS